MSKIAIYPGTFDPITNGHLDLILRAAAIFDEVIIAVSDNPRKSPLLDVEERQTLVRESTKHIPNLRIKTFDDLLVNFVRQQNARFVIRGLRAVSDFDYEFQMAEMNRSLDPQLEYVFLPTSKDCSVISSTLVREISALGGDISQFVHAEVISELARKNSKN